MKKTQITLILILTIQLASWMPAQEMVTVETEVADTVIFTDETETADTFVVTDETEIADAFIVSDETETAEIPATSPEIIDAVIDNDDTEFIAVPVTSPDIEGSKTTNGMNRISISLDDVALIDVVRLFSRLSGANIVANPEILSARITVTLDDVEWRPALSAILTMHNLALVERPQGSGVFSVVDQPPDAPVPMTVKTIFLKYTTVNEVRPVVERMLAGGSMSLFPSRNAMVIRATESTLNDITLVLEDIDIQAKQVVVETQFMELNDSAMKQLGIKWESLAEMGVNFQAGPFTTTRRTDRVTERSDELERRNMLYRFDGSDARFDEFGERQPSGAAFGFPEGVDIGQTAAGDPSVLSRRATEQSQLNRSDIVDGMKRTITQSSGAILGIDSLNMVLSALKTTDGVSIVSNPKIIVVSGSTNAFFSVGEREPIIKRTIARGTADSPGDQIIAELDTSINTDYIRSGYLNTGIELLVIPTVKTDDLIEAQIEPSLRRKVGEKTVDGNAWPEIAVKEIRTHFTLKSGQTVAIGGLTDTQESKETSKIPLLGDIPIIGKYLFSHTKDTKRQTETIIFVTLALADPMTISQDEGIPQRSELVHQRVIRDSMRNMEFQEELEELRKAARRLEEQFEKRQRDRNPAATGDVESAETTTDELTDAPADEQE